MAEDNIKVLIKKRGIIKTSLTRNKTFLDQLDFEEMEFSESYVRSRHSKFLEIWESFEQIQTEIDTLIDKDKEQMVAQEAERLNFEQAYFTIDSQYNDALDWFRQNEKQQSANNSYNFENNSVRLPVISLPEFSGSYSEYYSYFDSFNSLVHNNKNLDNTQKFHYLKSSLIGEALDLVKEFKLTSKNYEQAINLLKSRYDNRRCIIDSHVSAILNCPKVKDNSSNGLRTMVNRIERHLSALKAINVDVKSWDPILVHLITEKLDDETRKFWEMSLKSSELPSFASLSEFVLNASKNLHCSKTVNDKVKLKTFYTVNSDCLCCGESHSLFKCTKFSSMSISDRFKFIKAKNLCLNCFRTGHVASSCRLSSCRVCNKKHNTLLHFNNTKETEDLTTDGEPVIERTLTAVPCQNQQTDCKINQVASLNTNSSHSQALLFTCLVGVRSELGEFLTARAVLDTGSQSCLITSEFARRLNVPYRKVDVELVGISENSNTIKKAVDLQISSKQNLDFSVAASALVIDSFSLFLPSSSFEVGDALHLQGLKLADPNFNVSSNVDILLSSDVFVKALLPGKIENPDSGLSALNTQFGWIVCGDVSRHTSNNIYSFCTQIRNTSLEEMLEKFWKIEDVSSNETLLNSDDKVCEDHFLNTYKRNLNGRFVVNLPFRSLKFDFSHSRKFAHYRLQSLERQFDKNSRFKSLYVDFLKEYETLGHMQKVTDGSLGEYYLPHHGILRESSKSTKLRVVFDGTSTFHSNDSLNKYLYAGPKLQNSITDILYRWRTFSVAFVADIQKMFRQIEISEEDRKYLRILWRESVNMPVSEYQLSTVTYGTSCAPYQANRCLKQLSIDIENEFPIASKIINNDCYVDDFVSGADSVENAVECYYELSSALESSGFVLKKWMSNNFDFLKHIGKKASYGEDSFDIFHSDSLKVLGIQWSPKFDIFYYKIDLKFSVIVTKRNILSKIAQLFDPFGWIGPIVVISKMVMKELWLHKIDWDTEVNCSLKDRWLRFLKALKFVEDIKIPRFIGNLGDISIHAFSDASELAYGTCIYVACGNRSYLLSSKSRITPIKRVSIPRLELCSIHLMVLHLKELISSLRLSFDCVKAYTDSTVALAWIAKPAYCWKTFVANRVETIHSVLKPSQFYHVQSKDNPADILSRGMDPEKLKDCGFWWHGPEWLRSKSFECKSDRHFETEIDIKKPKTKVCILQFEETICSFSSFDRLVRIIAFIMRLKLKRVHRSSSLILSQSEIENSVIVICRQVQKGSFAQDYFRLKSGQSLSKKSKILSLNPFLDRNDVLRMDGRLTQNDLSFDQRHLIILPSGSKISKLIVRKFHFDNCHADVRLTCSLVRSKYWILRLKPLVKLVIRTCVVCQINRKILKKQLMGKLPEFRCNEGVPFLHVGIDYCGPFNYVLTRQRGKKKVFKSYGCVFVCLNTKACHLELVTNLETENFLAALTRFVGRRGLPAHIYSDNGKTFVGAANYLKELYAFMNANQKSFVDFCSSKGITWHYIPPYSPHMGGLWEACVKSLKYHLKRVMGNVLFTFEELSTILVKIESCLNSRPLCPLTEDKDELEILTPGHFLIGRPLLAIPNSDTVRTKVSLKERYNLIKKLICDVWVSWKTSYLHQLSVRNKWKYKNENLKINDLVIIKEKTIPLSWTKGRIEKVFYGPDGLIRVVEIRTKNGIIKRSLNNIVPIFFDSD